MIELRWFLTEAQADDAHVHDHHGRYAKLQVNHQDGLGWRDVPFSKRDARPIETLTQGEIARERGFTGDVCPVCGSFDMRRNGPCLLCSVCGATTGCS